MSFGLLSARFPVLTTPSCATRPNWPLPNQLLGWAGFFELWIQPAKALVARTSSMSIAAPLASFSITGIDLGDAVALDHLLVEHDAEARLVDDGGDAVLDGGAVEPHFLPDRVALGIGETFEVGAVRHCA